MLYADDDADDRELIREAFDEFSPVVELITFEEGGALLRYLQNLLPLQPKPCLVILDVNMHGLDGMKEYNEVPAILFTTSTLPAEAAFAQAHNAGFITKPLHGAQMSSIVNEFIDHCGNDLKEKIKRHRGD